MQQTAVSPLPRRIAGFTLTEIMVAIVISSILMLGVMQIFISSKRGYLLGDSLARLQENARFAMDSISGDMRMAGYVGCSGVITNQLDTTKDGYSDDLFGFSTGTGGWEYTNGTTSYTAPGDAFSIATLGINVSGVSTTNWETATSFKDGGGATTTGLPESLTNKVVPGTDVLVLKWAREDSNITVKDAKTNKNTINVNENEDIPQDSVLIISDCRGSDAFMKTNNTGSKTVTRGTASGHFPGNRVGATDAFSHDYGADATLMYATSRAYYIGQDVNGEPALFRMRYDSGLDDSTYISNVQEELIAEGVENMQVLYGEDTNTTDDIDGKANLARRYVTAENVSHDRVVSLRVGLLLRGDEAKENSAARTLTVLGTDVTTADDRRLRYVYTSTVKLRNRGVK